MDTRMSEIVRHKPLQHQKGHLRFNVRKNLMEVINNWFQKNKSYLWKDFKIDALFKGFIKG